MQILKDPFFHFVILGVIIFGLFDFSREPEGDLGQKTIVVDASTLSWIYHNFSKQFRRPPSRSEMQSLVDAYVESEVKYRESIALELDLNDSIVRRRMVQKFDFLFGIQAVDNSPGEEELMAYYKKNNERFEIPANVTFSHIYFDDSKLKKTLDFELIKKELVVGEKPMTDIFPFDDHYKNATPEMVHRVFGEEFTRVLFKLDEGGWLGPIRSGLGVHLIKIEAKETARLLPLQDVREHVLSEWRIEENRRLLTERLKTLKSHYDIDVAEKALPSFEYYSPDSGSAPATVVGGS